MSDQSYSLRTIYGLPTREILKGSDCVGLLYAPNARRPGWEIYPAIDRPDLTGGMPSYAAMEFTSEAAALSFLGIAEARP